MPDITVPGSTPVSKIKTLVGKKVSKEFPFCGDKVKVTKLTVAEIEDIQALARKQADAAKARQAGQETDGTGADDGMEIIRFVIRTAVEGADQLEDEDFRQFPMDELTTLANSIMSFSGMQTEGK